MPKAPISMCMITRNDPHLDKCLASFADHVEEICIVCNDPNDTYSKDIAAKYGAKFEVFTDCNDADSRIVDFSMARNKSMDLATQPFVMWCDSDDLIVGAEKLLAFVKAVPPDNMVLFPYEYAYNEHGQVLCRHYRERIAAKGKAHWVNPVHEVFVLKQQSATPPIISDEIVFKHQRQHIAKPMETTRNLRILKDHLAKNPDDVRNMYYYGLELSNHNLLDEAISYLTKYIDLSGWDDERVMACLKLVDIYQGRQDYKNGLKWAFKSLEIKDWFESYYAVSRMFYGQNNWQRCAHYGRLALQAPKTETLLFINESDRFTIHQFLNVALNNIGAVQEALDSVNAGLVGLPNDTHLNHNKRIYERHLNLAPTGKAPAKEEKVPLPELDTKHLDIVFVAGPSYENWTPESVQKTGIGGSETMLIEQAKNLAALGHKVRVYASPFVSGSVFDGVTYFHLSEFGNLSCDVLVVSRYAQFLADQFNVNARLRLLWVHDVCAVGATNELLLKADKILCLSNWHKNNVIQVHNVHPDHVIVTRNGIDITKFQFPVMEKEGEDWKIIKRNQYRCVNSSSPDRSWAVLLDVFPKIKAQVPQAELHLYYGFENWRKIAGNDQLQLDLINRLEHAAKNTEGVFYHGRVSQDELCKEFMISGVILYPTWFSETSCITMMQAQVAGLNVVTSNIAALKETVKNGVLLDGEWTSKEYQEKFIAEAVKALNDNRTDLQRLSPSIAVDFGLTALAREWETMFINLLEQTKTHPLNPYQPTKPYQHQKRKSNLVKLNIAAGPNVFPHDGWINLDKYDFKSYFDYVSNPNVTLDGMPEHQQKLATFLREGGDFRFEQHDCTKPFIQFADNSVDFIYGGQMIEHLNPIHQTPVFLKECFRMLKPGGIIRLTTPDLDLLVRAYTNWAPNINTFEEFEKDQPDFFKTADRGSQLAFLLFGATGQDCVQEQYQGHFFCFNQQSMTRFLTEAGFTEIDFTWANCGKNKSIAMEIKDEGVSHSLIVEALKPNG